MSNTRDNSPELDYFELRRRHEQYKSRARMEQSAEKFSAADKPARVSPAVEEEEIILRPQPEFVEEIEEQADPLDAFDEAIEEGYEDYADDDDYGDEDAPVENPNPFDSFIHFFKGVKNTVSTRRGGKRDDFEELDDLDDITEEELAELEAEENGEAPAKRRMAVRMPVPQDDEDDDAGEAALDIDGGFDNIETSFENHNDAFADDDFEDEDLEDDLPQKSGFKKFVNLFVTRIDEEDEEEIDEDELDELIEDSDLDDADLIEEDEDDEEEEAPKRKGLFGRSRRKDKKTEDDEIDEEKDALESFIPNVRSKPEGGLNMEEMNKPASAPAPQAAPAAESAGMTRRERRELAMRLAAEEAARKAAEEAKAKAEAGAIEPLFSEPAPEAQPDTIDMAAFENAPATDILVETTVEEAPAIEEIVDEPTREFTPVSMRDVQEVSEKSLFSAEVSADDEDEDYDDEEDDEEEIVEKKPRRGLFGRKRARVEEDEDDYDDDEDDEDYDDEDDDEEEVVEKKPRRGLFGRKRARVEDEDDEEDEEDYDDDDASEDDYDDDEDDEYDEYDDDEDDDYDDDEDEYDDDDDEPRRSFGHHLIGIFKFILGVILALLVVVIVLNFLYIGGQETIVGKLHDSMGDSAAFNLMFPSYAIRETMPAEEIMPEVELEAEITPEPTALPAPEATAVVPNLNEGTTDLVIEAAPVVQEAVVTEGAIG